MQRRRMTQQWWLVTHHRPAPAATPCGVALGLDTHHLADLAAHIHNLTVLDHSLRQPLEQSRRTSLPAATVALIGLVR